MAIADPRVGPRDVRRHMEVLVGDRLVDRAAGVLQVDEAVLQAVEQLPGFEELQRAPGPTEQALRLRTGTDAARPLLELAEIVFGDACLLYTSDAADE